MVTKSVGAKKMGAPRKDIDFYNEKDRRSLEGFCTLNATHGEIANVFGVSTDTLYRRSKEYYGEDFSSTYKKFSDSGRMSLRRMQFKLAEKNVAMAIFLGKNMLNQRDNVDKNAGSELVIERVCFSEKGSVVKKNKVAGTSSKIVPVNVNDGNDGGKEDQNTA